MFTLRQFLVSLHSWEILEGNIIWMINFLGILAFVRFSESTGELAQWPEEGKDGDQEQDGKTAYTEQWKNVVCEMETQRTDFVGDCVPKDVIEQMHACMHSHIHTCMHTYIHTCMHTYIHTHTHTHTHNFLQTSVLLAKNLLTKRFFVPYLYWY
jgi:hypothetical protein